MTGLSTLDNAMTVLASDFFLSFSLRLSFGNKMVFYRSTDKLLGSVTTNQYLFRTSLLLYLFRQDSRLEDSDINRRNDSDIHELESASSVSCGSSLLCFFFSFFCLCFSFFNLFFSLAASLGSSTSSSIKACTLVK